MNSTTEPPTRGFGPPPSGWISNCLRGVTNSILRKYRSMTATATATDAPTAPPSTATGLDRQVEIHREIVALCNRLGVQGPKEWADLATFSPEAEASDRKHLPQVARDTGR